MHFWSGGFIGFASFEVTSYGLNTQPPIAYDSDYLFIIEYMFFYDSLFCYQCKTNWLAWFIYPRTRFYLSYDLMTEPYILSRYRKNYSYIFIISQKFIDCFVFSYMYYVFFKIHPRPTGSLACEPLRSGYSFLFLW